MNASYSEARKAMRVLKDFGYRYSGNGIFTKRLEKVVRNQTKVATDSISIERALDTRFSLADSLTFRDGYLHGTLDRSSSVTTEGVSGTLILGPGETDESLEEVKRYLLGEVKPKEPHLKLVEDPKPNESDPTSGDND